MATTTIDMQLPDALQIFLQQPQCIDLSLPKPEKVNIRLPTGGTIPGVADFTKGIPSDCSLSFSLVLQLLPLLASMECIIKILKLVEPLKEVIDSLTQPQKLPGVIPKFISAATDLINNCLIKLTTPLGLGCFLLDILRLIVKLLQCIIGQLKTLASLIGGLTLQITSAQAVGNTALLASLECAQGNAMTSAQHAAMAVEPLIVILELVGPLLGLVGVGSVEIPAIGSAEDVESLNQVIATLESVVETLALVVDTLAELCG